MKLIVTIRLLVTFMIATADSTVNSLSFAVRIRLDFMTFATNSFETPTTHAATNKRPRKNKYQEFSKAAPLDPIEQAINAKVIAEKEMANNLEPSRGTTVPLNSEPLKLRNKQVENATSVVPNDPFTFGYAKIGDILGPHGVKGEIKAQLSTDFFNLRMQNGSVVFIKKPNRRTPRPIRVISGRRQVGDTYILVFENVRSRMMAAAFCKYEIYVRKEDRPDLKDNEYLLRDLVGLDCFLDEKTVGVDLNVNRNSAFAEIMAVVTPSDLCDAEAAKFMHSILEIKKKDSEEMCYIPFVPDIVTAVDIPGKRCIILPPPGLLDMTWREKKKVVIRGLLPAAAMHMTDEKRQQLLREYRVVIVNRGAIRRQL